MLETANAGAVSPKAWQQLPATFGWSDLVLPPREDEQLRAIATEWDERWRDASGHPPTRAPGGKPGILVLFCGPAGTGKTMAAQTLAHELRLVVIQADLGSVLVRDRWRMTRLFAIAARTGAVLVFDHAETMIREAVDADGSGLSDTGSDLTELLDRSASHRGIVIFATRLQRPEAEPVLGRFDFVTEFPFPGRAGREEIWRRQLAETDVGEPDIAALAGALDMTGGEIAACCAAAKQSCTRAGVPLGIDHVVRALERDCPPESLSHSRNEALEQLRARIKSQTGDWSDRDRPEAEAPAEPTPRTSSTTESSRTRRPFVLPASAGAAASSADATPHPSAAQPAEASSAPATADPSVAQPAEASSTPARADPSAAQPAEASSAPATADPSAAQPAEAAATAPAAGRLPVADGVTGRDGVAKSTRSRGWVIAGLTGILIAAALGLALAGAKNQSALPPLDRQAQAGPALVSYPASWHSGTAPAFPGAGLSDAVAVSPAASGQHLLAVGTSTAAGATLLPPKSLASVSSPVIGQVVKLGTMWFYRFPGLALRGDPGPETVYALPTTAGVVVSVCLNPGDGFTGTCERLLAALQLRPGVQALVAKPEYPHSLSGIIAKLDAVRAQAASQLAAANTAGGQSSIENGLAHANAVAASAIARLDAGPAQAANTALASALKSTAQAYAAMARAASEQDASAYRAASSSLARAAAATGSASADLRQFGYTVG